MEPISEEKAVDPFNNFFMFTVSQPTVYKPIFNYSTPGTMYSVGRTCKAAQTCVLQYQLSAFNINTHLARFLPDPIEFRSMQARTGTIISGSNALQFMDRVHYRDADLDIYVNPGHGSIVGTHMVKVQGYRVVDLYGDGGPVTLDLWDSLIHVVSMAVGAAREVVKSRYQQRSIHILTNMERITEAGLTQRVQVMVTADCVFHAIMSYHSTCVMNVITYDRAISFYPLASFEFRNNQPLALYGASLSSAASAREAIEKYRTRGFNTLHHHSPSESRLLFHHGSERKVGDRWCWTIRFKMDDVSPRQWVEDGLWELEPESEESEREEVSALRAMDPIMHNKWLLTGFLFILSPKYCLLRLPIFRYGYTVSSNLEAQWARKFSDDIEVVRRNGGCGDRKWFDNIVTLITEGRISVRLDGVDEGQDAEAESEDDDSEDALSDDDHYPGLAYPIKVTDLIKNSELLAMLKRYRKAYEDEESDGRRWRKKRDAKRVMSN
ncbi:hypothetical protein HWV62_7946 [Athelia sp. TMB]|nr:hypothetical protein HWV62_7946 [Athelia sp. TMB]